MNIKFIYRK